MRWIMGKHALEEVLKQTPKRLLEVHTYKKNDPFVHLLKEKGMKVSMTSKHTLASIVRSVSHQGFIAKVREREFLTVKEFLKTAPEKSLVLMCDAVQDPQNFGSILRAAECFGVDAVIYSTNRNVALTPVVSKASVGASEIVPLLPVSNLVDALKTFQSAGYFSVATEISDRARLLNSFEFPERTVLIVGTEGLGIQPLLSKKSDFHLYIPMKGSIDSLNVSQATAVLLSHWH
ncbi:MAG: 23S rRNA (guanosine(2251)-2'-O)-methyltransferase RlmB [Chlamydiota bacterium]